MNDDPIRLDRPELLTERLLLRRPHVGDQAAIARIAGDWEVARHLARVPHPYGLADAMFFLEQIVPHEWVWAITVSGSPELVGVAGLAPDDSPDVVDLGYWLSRADWGKGFMTEAANAVVAHGFDTLPITRIKSSYFVENPASGRVLDKLGFVETGRAMLPCLASGSEMPAVKMHLLRSA